MRQQLVQRNIVPADLSALVSRACQLPAGKNVQVTQSRDYRVDCANGDTIYIQKSAPKSESMRWTNENRVRREASHAGSLPFVP